MLFENEGWDTDKVGGSDKKFGYLFKNGLLAVWRSFSHYLKNFWPDNKSKIKFSIYIHDHMILILHVHAWSLPCQKPYYYLAYYKKKHILIETYKTFKFWKWLTQSTKLIRTALMETSVENNFTRNTWYFISIITY